MSVEKRQYIGQSCYLSLSSKPELVQDDNLTRIPLTVTEYKLLSIFIDHKNSPVYLEELARYIWGANYGADDKDPNSLKSHITHIRNKLEKLQPGLRNCLETNYGLNSYTLKIAEPASFPNGDIGNSVEINSPNYIGQVKTNIDKYLYNKKTGKEIKLPKGMLLVGRDSRKCDLCLDSSKVSGIHAKLCILDDGKTVVEDLRAVNGTFINGARLVPGQKYILGKEDNIRFADFEFTYIEEG